MAELSFRRSGRALMKTGPRIVELSSPGSPVDGFDPDEGGGHELAYELPLPIGAVGRAGRTAML